MPGSPKLGHAMSRVFRHPDVVRILVPKGQGHSAGTECCGGLRCEGLHRGCIPSTTHATSARLRERTGYEPQPSTDLEGYV